MTTIAWDGRVLAADTLGNWAGQKLATHKIRKCGEYVYAAAGWEAEVQHIARWIASGAKLEDAPVEEEDGSWGIAIHVHSGHVFRVAGKRVALCLVYGRFVADGSGRDYATAAMFLGHPAPVAVAVAAHFDTGTRLPIDAFSRDTNEIVFADLGLAGKCDVLHAALP